MATNDFIGFASAGSANIMSQADYATAAEHTDGVQPGPASSKLANKIWRQGSNMASAIGGLVSDYGYNALDDGDIATLKGTLKNAFLLSNDLTSQSLENASVPTNAMTNIGSITFSRGVYFLSFSLAFAANNSGFRQIVVATSATGSALDRYHNLIFGNAADGTPIGRLICFMSVNAASATYYLNAYQNSGSTLATSLGCYQYYKVRYQ